MIAQYSSNVLLLVGLSYVRVRSVKDRRSYDIVQIQFKLMISISIILIMKKYDVKNIQNWYLFSKE